MRGGDHVYRYDRSRDQWTPLSFAKRLYCGMCIWDGKLALVGGVDGRPLLAGSKTIYRSSGGGATGSVVVWERDRWVGADVPAMPVPCMWPAAVADDGGGSRLLLVIGGLDVDGQPMNRVQVYDGSRGEWHCSQQLPKACSNASCAVWENSVYLAGGDGLGTDVYCANLRDLVSCTHLN